jgi:hypothetical protein
MALSRLIRPLHVGASTMSCIIAQKHRPANAPLDQAADGFSILDTAIGSKSAGNKARDASAIHTISEKHEKEQISRQACDASGNLYHRFHFQEP